MSKDYLAQAMIDDGIVVEKHAEASESAVERLVMPICDDKLQVIYEHGQPKGIRDAGGFLFFFPTVSKYQGQEERYRQEIEQQYKLADYLLNALLKA